MGIIQATRLEWVAMLSSRVSSQPRDQTQVSRIASRLFTVWATREAWYNSNKNPIYKTYSKIQIWELDNCGFLLLEGEVEELKSLSPPFLKSSTKLQETQFENHWVANVRVRKLWLMKKPKIWDKVTFQCQAPGLTESKVSSSFCDCFSCNTPRPNPKSQQQISQRNQRQESPQAWHYPTAGIQIASYPFNQLNVLELLFSDYESNTCLL